MTIHQQPNGFALVDVLVSFLVASLVLSVMLQAVSHNMEASERTADLYRATSFARSKIAALGVSEPLAEGSRQGQFDAVFHWSLTVGRDAGTARLHLASPLAAYSVRLEVTWTRGKRLFRQTFRTLRLEPAST